MEPRLPPPSVTAEPYAPGDDLELRGAAVAASFEGHAGDETRRAAQPCVGGFVADGAAGDTAGFAEGFGAGFGAGFAAAAAAAARAALPSGEL